MGKNRGERELKTTVYERLIKEMGQGSKDSLRTFYMLTKPAIYGFVLAMSVDYGTAEETMHEAYIAIFDAAETYCPKGKPMVWAFTVVRNVVLTKALQQAPAAPEPEAIPDEDAPQSGMDMTRMESQIIMLRDVAGVKYREIAEILEISRWMTFFVHRRAMSRLGRRTFSKLNDFIRGNGKK